MVLPPSLFILKNLKEQYGDTIKKAVKQKRQEQKKRREEKVEEIVETIKETADMLSSPVKAHIDRITKGESCKNDKKIKLYAILAAHCYGNYSDNILPSNCFIVKEHYGKDGTEAIVYRISDKEVVCAFRGTDGADLKDWGNNIVQLAGVSPQYDNALEFAESMTKLFDISKITFVGHSKGGGQAAYCALQLGRDAVTFNPAGISLPTRLINKCVHKSESKIHAYIFRTDILNMVQDIFSSIGIQADGQIHYINDIEPTGRQFFDDFHGMAGILDYFGVKF